MEIISNGVARELVPFEYLPEKAQREVRENYENAPYMEWVRYKGQWYCPEDFMIAPQPLRDAGWEAFASDTFFSGVVVRYVDGDYDGRLVFGRYFS